MTQHIIQILCDDLGYGDTGYAGHPRLQTPGLDRMANEGLIFDRFYAGGPVCSPTRGTCLTGRHYIRYGITHANQGRLPDQEITLPQLLREHGFTTGHFGKWHLGTLDPQYSSKPNRDPERNFAPPWLRGYDDAFATESRVPTWDPQRGIDGRTGTRTDTVWEAPYYHNGKRVTESLTGCDSAIIMDRALDFIERAVGSDTDSYTTIWFHAPHTPVVAGPEWLEQYTDCNEDEAHYYGCVSAMDHQINRLLTALDTLGISQCSTVWFASDNGPEGSEDLARNGRNRGQTGGLRGRKRSLYSGGIQVPALLYAPGRIAAGQRCSVPASTLDYLPTICASVNIPTPTDRPLDGIDLGPVLRGEAHNRGTPIPFRFLANRDRMFGSPTFGLIGDDFTFHTNLANDHSDEAWFDPIHDPGQSTNLIDQRGAQADAKREQLAAFLASCRRSHNGHDYADPACFDPVTGFQEPGAWAEQIR